jgi:hypothetical protein
MHRCEDSFGLQFSGSSPFTIAIEAFISELSLGVLTSKYNGGHAGAFVWTKNFRRLAFRRESSPYVLN